MAPKALRTPVRIDATSPIPPFEQLRAQLALMISAGRLRPGERLPAVRRLALQVGLSNGTVARAYRELEYHGLITARGRQGTFVVDAPPTGRTRAQRLEVLERAAEALVDTTRQLDLELDDATGAVAEAWTASDEPE